MMFSIFIRRELTFFAVVWTTCAYDDKCSNSSYVPSGFCMVITGVTFCWKVAEFKSVVSQILLQGIGLQSTCFLSPCVRLSETSLHPKSWIIYLRKRRIHWAIFLICCSLEITQCLDYSTRFQFKASQKNNLSHFLLMLNYGRSFSASRKSWNHVFFLQKPAWLRPADLHREQEVWY